MTELIEKLSNKQSCLDLIRGHRLNYWCRKGGHWLLKDSAIDQNGKLFCPEHQSQVSEHTRNASYKHEERVVRY